MRGVLTPRIREMSRLHLGREIDTTELRLMPYVQFVMVNDQRIDPNKCNGDDRAILSKWRAEGHIAGGAGGLYITREFWDIVNDLVFEAYVANTGGELTAHVVDQGDA